MGCAMCRRQKQVHAAAACRVMQAQKEKGLPEKSFEKHQGVW
jgi:hypothetical protein